MTGKGHRRDDDRRISRFASAFAGAVVRDPEDLRDLQYRPTLLRLPDCFLSPALQAGTGRQKVQVRSQADAPRCIGEALAALIDIQRLEGGRNDATQSIAPVSAAMLQAMAIEMETLDRGEQVRDVYSLRSGLKGFYNTGVCTEATWSLHVQGAGRGARFDSANVAVMKEARNVTLGAYYRVASSINDYHAALVEAGALYVAAEIHGGWNDPKMGVIGPDSASPPSGGHAFVVVGYTEEGFLVLNSWGPDWGRFRFDGDELPGVALWSYADWSRNVLDAWVMRLAAPTPASVREARGTHGLANFAAGRLALASSSVRRMEVLGRYIHLDDGCHVVTGAHASSRLSLETTIEYLRSPQSIPHRGAVFHDLVLRIHGCTAQTEDVLLRLAQEEDEEKARGVRTMALVWSNDLLSAAAAALEPHFEAALEISAGNPDDADRRIQRTTRPVGRAIWRDVKAAATKAAGARGDARHALRELASLCRTCGKRLHIVTEGAGSLLLAALVGRTGSDADAQNRLLADVLASLVLIAPLSTQRSFDKDIAPFLRLWGGSAEVVRAGYALDERLRVGAYSRSWTDLVGAAFETEPSPLIGAPGPALKGVAQVDLYELDPPPRRSGELGSEDVLRHHEATRIVWDAILRARRAAPGQAQAQGRMNDDDAHHDRRAGTAPAEARR